MVKQSVTPTGIIFRMKQYLSTALALVCIVLVIALIVIKRTDNAQHESDAGAITDYSNRLDSAHTETALYNGKVLTLSNSLDERSSAALTFSNQLTEAQASMARDTQQITSLNSRVAEVEAENKILNQHVTESNSQWTNQVDSLTQQLTSTKTNLSQANQDYVLLENRLRRDVAERLVIQRKFYNLAALQTQIDRLKDDPFTPQVTEQGIYAGLDVEVRSNSLYVISPN
jgi:chromosome segregation ATPase